MSRSSKTWMEIATAQKVRPPWAKEIKDVLMRAKVNDIVAARDRDSFSDPWRRVLLKKVSKSTWLLLDEKRLALRHMSRVGGGGGGGGEEEEEEETDAGEGGEVFSLIPGAAGCFVARHRRGDHVANKVDGIESGSRSVQPHDSSFLRSSTPLPSHLTFGVKFGVQLCENATRVSGSLFGCF
jgi:hypothetical protein